MELQHSFTVPAPVDQAWATLLDIKGVAPCFPGATLTSVEGEEFTGTVKVKLGPVSLQYAGKGRFVERDDAAHTATIEATGSDKRGNGTAGAHVKARMEPESESSTKVVVDTDLKITGRPAQFGRGVIQDVGGRIIQSFADNLAAQMAGGGATAASAPEAAPEPAAAQAASAEAPAAGTPAAAPATSETDQAQAPGAPDATTSAPVADATAGTDAAPSASIPTAAPAAASRPAAPRPAPVHHTSAPPAQEPAAELDLGAHVWPVLLRSYGPRVAAGLGVFTLLLVVLRRRRHR